MQGSSWKATADTWKRMDIRDTTIFQGSDAALVGRISVDTSSMPFQKENSMTTASRQFRESSTATGYSPLRTPLTKNIPVIMKSGSSCVSRRKNLFWRLSGRGSISRSLSANVKHFFTLLGKMFFTSYGKEFFIYHGKQIFTSQGKHLFTRYGKQTLSSAQPCG